MSPQVDFFESSVFSRTFEDVRSGFLGSGTASNLKSPAELPDEGGTVFCVAFGNKAATVIHQGYRYTLEPGMYGSIQTPASILGDNVWYVLAQNHKALNSVGGPLEETGRLRYIDGCTDSLIVAPVIKGDPCLNLLYFPPGIDQTFHTHPSCRLGLVVSGSGFCEDDAGETELNPGLAFHIPKDGVHRFVTRDEPLRIVAFHPDSDFGPEHDFHPMINKTIVDGLSARHIDSIRTTS
jgi:quercetin dioxygenase-like cupin family protein